MKLVSEKVLSLAVLLTSVLVAAQPSQARNIRECISNGLESGRFAADQFCTSLESSYNNNVMQMATYSQAERLCSGLIVIACRASLRIAAANRPLCKSLLASNWNNAREDFEGFIPVACPR
jgi:hypothetical protein